LESISPSSAPQMRTASDHPATSLGPGCAIATRSTAIFPKSRKSFPESCVLCGYGATDVIEALRRKSDFARETFSAPVEPHVSPLMTSYHGLHYLSAKTFACRRLDGRTSQFGPAQYELSAPRDHST
jgi:hypothetical protein